MFYITNRNKEKSNRNRHVRFSTLRASTTRNPCIGGNPREQAKKQQSCPLISSTTVAATTTIAAITAIDPVVKVAKMRRHFQHSAIRQLSDARLNWLQIKVTCV
ncbi:hypothetical protein GWI33_005787 [Rhynchophorus ferrugineus]|uniref:Uncharacterized protein n=1 Tax=Rhynchophorus ferrugineus TaxID=354439 RepID=A0A834J2J2_RHYFE|nr:hypothetical protein GWI33_005787 [Rhynchophorus ferrugineus]